MNCLEARRLIGGLGATPPLDLLGPALDHAATCPRCRSLALGLADAVLAAAGDELSCAEARRRLPLLVGRPAAAASKPTPDLLSLRVHLSTCADCRAEQALLEAMLQVDPLSIALPERRWDLGFAAEPPHRRAPTPAAPGAWLPKASEAGRRLLTWIRGIAAGRPAEAERRPAWALAALTVVLLAVLVRVLLQDPQVQRSIERLLPALSDPRPTADLAALRATATAAAAGSASPTQTLSPGRTATLPSPAPSQTASTATQGATAAETKERARPTAAGGPPPDAPATAAPGEPTVPPSPAPTEAPYPPPDPADEPPNPYPDPPTSSPVEPPAPTLEP